MNNLRLKLVITLLSVSISLNWLSTSAKANSFPPNTPGDLIAQTNAARKSYGYNPLQEDSFLMQSAQTSAEIMAEADNCTHAMYLGYPSVTERAKKLGYGNNNAAFVTENIACLNGGNSSFYTKEWSTDDYLLPVSGPQASLYKHIGAGAAQGNSGKWYYVVHAGYTTGAYNNPSPPPFSTPLPAKPTRSVTPDLQNTLSLTATHQEEDGSLWHVVKPGQTFSTIAQKYSVTVEYLKTLNNRQSDTLFAGEKILIQPAYTPTAAPGITHSPTPFTAAPQPTPTLPQPTATFLPVLTNTPTPPPDKLFLSGNRRILGFGVLIICLAGVLYLWISGKKTY